MRDTIFNHFADTVTLERHVSTNEFNERTFGTPTNITCRLIENDTIVKTRANEDVNSSFRVYTNTQIGELDRINGKDVLRIKEHQSLFDNEVIGYTVFI